jgi:hypothetical protein
MKVSYLLTLLLIILSIKCKENAPSSYNLETGKIIGIWENTEINLPQGNSIIIKYFTFNSDTTCKILYLNGNNFKWSYDGRFTIQGNNILIESTDYYDHKLKYNGSYLIYNDIDLKYKRVNASPEIDNWVLDTQVQFITTINVNSQTFGLANDGSSFYTYYTDYVDNIINFSETGETIRIKQLTYPDSLRSNYFIDLEYSDGYLWLTMKMVRNGTLIVYKIELENLTFVQTKLFNYSVKPTLGFTKQSNSKYFWTTANSGLGEDILYKVDYENEIIVSTHNSILVSGFDYRWNDGVIWTANIRDYGEQYKYHLDAIDTELNKSIKSVSLTGFPKRTEYPFYFSMTGMDFANSSVYFIERYDNSLWKAVMPE